MLQSTCKSLRGWLQPVADAPRASHVTARKSSDPKEILMRSSIIGTLVLASLSGMAFADSQKPTVPENVNATALSDTSVRVTWSESYDDNGVDGYNIYRNDRYYATVHDTTSFIDERVSPGTEYRYAVVAFDGARNYTVLSDADGAVPGGGSGTTGAAPRASTESAAQDAADVSSGSSERPAPPTGLRAEAEGGDRIKVSWNAAPDASGYNVYRDGSYRSTVRGESWTDSGLDGGREYRYDVVTISSDSRYSRKFSLNSDSVVARTGGGGSSDTQATVAAAPSDDDGGSSSSGIPSGYRLVFSEEFEGGSIDSSKWNTSYRWGPNWTINSEQQYYVDTNSNPDFGVKPFEFGGGKLNIVADKTPSWLKGSANNKSYTSGVLTTYGKFKMKYGYVEIRAKMPKGQGLWPAFWMLNHYDNGNEPEIDIMEFLGRETDTVYQVYHSRSGKSGTLEYEGPDFTSGYHTFAVDWSPGKLVFYVDGKETNRYESGNVSDEDMYIIVNLALGGSWGGEVDGSTPFPARYSIDYIRAYQR